MSTESMGGRWIEVIGEFSAPELSRNINQARAALARAGVQP